MNNEKFEVVLRMSKFCDPCSLFPAAGSEQCQRFLEQGKIKTESCLIMQLVAFNNHKGHLLLLILVQLHLVQHLGMRFG